MMEFMERARCPVLAAALLICLTVLAAGCLGKKTTLDSRPAPEGEPPPPGPAGDPPPPAEDADPPAAEAAAPIEGLPLPEGALDFRLDLDLKNEHGCSQSMASDSLDGTMMLQVSEGDEAALSLEYERFYTIGPSLGKFKEGMTNFTHTTTLLKNVWSGRAERKPRSVTLEFKTVQTSSVKYEGYGKAELPAPNTEPSTLRLDCILKVIEAYPPVRPGGSPKDTENENPGEAEAMLCRSSQELLEWFSDVVLIEDALPFGPGPGLTLIYDRFYSVLNETHLVRLNKKSGKKKGGGAP